MASGERRGAGHDEKRRDQAGEGERRPQDEGRTLRDERPRYVEHGHEGGPEEGNHAREPLRPRRRLLVLALQREVVELGAPPIEDDPRGHARGEQITADDMPEPVDQPAAAEDTDGVHGGEDQDHHQRVSASPSQRQHAGSC